MWETFYRLGFTDPNVGLVIRIYLQKALAFILLKSIKVTQPEVEAFPVPSV